MSPASPSLTDSQLSLLKAGPLHIFALVAGADSLADQREWAALVEAVRAGANHADALVCAVLRATDKDLGERPTSAGESEAALAALEEIRVVAEALGDGGTALLATLLEMGVLIAEASGAQVTRTFVKGAAAGWAKASGTSAMEHAALDRAAAALGLA